MDALARRIEPHRLLLATDRCLISSFSSPRLHRPAASSRRISTLYATTRAIRPCAHSTRPIRVSCNLYTREYSQQTYKAAEPDAGLSTPSPESSHPIQLPYYFAAGYALFAKRRSRPFPPPFSSPPSGSFSDPLSTHDKSRYRRGQYEVEGTMIRGVTNGDDAVLAADNFVAVGDGVGAWAAKERGHAALWSRLILHFWATAAEEDAFGGEKGEPDMVRYLGQSFQKTKDATSKPNEWLGTTTACGSILQVQESKPVLWVTQLGDSKILVVRPRGKDVVYRTLEQWHWFDCPRQLGTNSPDTPELNAVCERVDVEDDDMVLAMSDGVVDNLWEHEVVENVCQSLEKWRDGTAEPDTVRNPNSQQAEGMRYVASELVKAAKVIAQDPFAESPYMERAVEEGLAMEGGKLDDISVVAAMITKRNG